ncbi:MAG: hypothetical protein ACJ8FS_15530 [Sphingomicrobium sp.]
MRKAMLVIGTAALAACGQSGETSNQAAVAKMQPKKRPAYCFFKDSETKGWAASRGKDGNITVKGKAYREDPRYKAVLGPPSVTATSAEIAPTIGVNDTGYAAADNWWDVKATIPNSAAIESVIVRCGQKTIADLTVPPKG